jgi:hypothetical protein
MTGTSVRSSLVVSRDAAGHATNAASIARHHQIATTPMRYQVVMSVSRAIVDPCCDRRQVVEIRPKNRYFGLAARILAPLKCQPIDDSVRQIDMVVTGARN